MTDKLTLTISCPDRVGIVAAVSGVVAAENGWITEASYHSDASTGRFFMRNVILAESLVGGADRLRAHLHPLAQQFQMDWRLTHSARRKRVVILVSKLDHCLYDILHRWKSGEYAVDIPCVISNHPDLREFVEWNGIEFIHLLMSPDAKAQAFAQIAERFEAVAGDVLVLARFMQILPQSMCQRYPGRIINIHHSFLPSFVGAKPYHQAFERGVKLIGATCHYVTAVLDDGPIIEQDVIRIDHDDTVEDLVGYGRDIEKTVLARGLRFHLEDRVLLNGSKTVVFR